MEESLAFLVWILLGGGLILGPVALVYLWRLPMRPAAKRGSSLCVSIAAALIAVLPSVYIVCVEDWGSFGLLWCIPAVVLIALIAVAFRRLNAAMLAGMSLPPTLTWSGLTAYALIDNHLHPDAYFGLFIMFGSLILGAFAGLAAFVGALIVVPRAKRRNADEQNCCPRCGYSRQGLPSLVCPECGHAAKPKAAS